MDSRARDRFAFLAEAFHGVGGFAPRAVWETQLVDIKAQDGSTLTAERRVPKLAAPCHLVPHVRESPEKFAARAAIAVYENHLREACERFIGFLSRRRPMRDGIDAPLVGLMLADADMRGNALDVFWSQFALHAKARGSMLLLIDMPSAPGEDGPVSLQDQIARRAVPYLRSIPPESVKRIEIDDETGLVASVEIASSEMVGAEQATSRRWDAAVWQIKAGDRVLDEGAHPFGQCPVLAFTESGDLFPHVGKYAQIADMSRGIFNNRSRLDELMGNQGFPILALQIPPEAAQYNVLDVVATIGTSSMLVHQGITPAFVTADQGNAETYLKIIAQLQASVSRTAADEASEDNGRRAESGVSRRLRFERLNSDLASFAHKLQSLESRMWALFHRALGTNNRVAVEWPSDFNLVDTAAELDILMSMQATGFPEAVTSAKRATIVGAEFDAADEETKAALLAAVNEQAQAAPL